MTNTVEEIAARWAKVRPEAVCGGSDAQAINVFRDALADIAKLANAASRAEVRGSHLMLALCMDAANYVAAQQERDYGAADTGGAAAVVETLTSLHATSAPLTPEMARDFAAAVLRRAGYHHLPYELEHGCLRLRLDRTADGAHLEEPIFVQRGQDPTAESGVQDWIRKNAQTCGEDKLDAAAAVAARMARYPHRKSAAD